MSSRFLRRAPENFLGPQQVRDVRAGRRGFLAGALGSAMAAAATGVAAQSNPLPAAGGDPNILNLPDHSKSLGQAVAARGYGLPSVWEKNLQRRESPGLTRVSQSSVSFCPLQGLFGIITPNGLHFERHHQGWWDI
ncbi:MAG: sulfite dehydrogenase, partial [Rhodoferax sp.]|nr:sulfite dehydrogenase [Rhodoferax sp.]